MVQILRLKDFVHQRYDGDLLFRRNVGDRKFIPVVRVEMDVAMTVGAEKITKAAYSQSKIRSDLQDVNLVFNLAILVD